MFTFEICLFLSDSARRKLQLVELNCQDILRWLSNVNARALAYGLWATKVQGGVKVEKAC